MIKERLDVLEELLDYYGCEADCRRLFEGVIPWKNIPSEKVLHILELYSGDVRGESVRIGAEANG